jgi:hypothetical protein
MLRSVSHIPGYTKVDGFYSYSARNKLIVSLNAFSAYSANGRSCDRTSEIEDFDARQRPAVILGSRIHVPGDWRLTVIWLPDDIIPRFIFRSFPLVEKSN